MFDDFLWFLVRPRIYEYVDIIVFAFLYRFYSLIENFFAASPAITMIKIDTYNLNLPFRMKETNNWCFRQVRLQLLNDSLSLNQLLNPDQSDEKNEAK